MNWIKLRLGDVCEKIGSGATPRGGSEVYLSSGEIALIRSQNILNFEFSRDGLVYITALHAAELENVTVQPDDVLLNITGDSVARCWQVPNDVLPARVNQHVAIIRPKPKELDARFLRYFLTNPAMQNHMLMLAGAGATRNALTKSMIESFEITAPSSLAEQRTIAQVLGALDDKIELNRRMNETLEAMARAIFKSWFVDFDPVRAKAEGRQPYGMDAETAALFPDGFEDSALGEVPRGWRVASIKDAVANVYDGPHATPPESTEGPIYLGIKNFTGTQLDLSDIRHISETDWINWTRRVTPQPEDIVFTYEATLGFFAIIPPGIRCCLGRRTALIRPKSRTNSTYYLFHYFIAPPFQTLLKARVQTGSTVDRILLSDFPNYEILMPTQTVIEKFNQIAKPFHAQIDFNNAQSRNLVRLRDMLLPNLLSGKVKSTTH